MSGAARRLLRQATDPFAVSDFAEGEVASAISRLVRTRELTPDQGVGALAVFDRWLPVAATRVSTESADIRAAILLVRQFDLKLRTPDALHLAISHRVSATLVTFDDRLALAAQAFGLSVLTP